MSGSSNDGQRDDGQRGGGQRDPDDITARMAAIRGDLYKDAHRLAQSGQRVLDWTAHVREHPWTSFGLAALAAYYLVPKRVEVRRPTSEQLVKLAEDNRVVIEANPTPAAKATFLSGLTALVTHTVLRGALGVLGHEIGRLMQPSEPKAPGDEAREAKGQKPRSGPAPAPRPGPRRAPGPR